MGHLEFGKLAKIRRIAYYTLSPHEQIYYKPKKMFFNGLRRFRESALMVTIPFSLFFFLRYAANEIADKALLKNPKDYENDV